MVSPWPLYQSHPSLVLGFHGTDGATVDRLLPDPAQHLQQSAGRFEWLGHGIYFWENDPQRAMEWAKDGRSKSKIQSPDAVGAVLDLKFCLDLTTRSGLDEVAEAYELLAKAYREADKRLPANTGGLDNPRRELDCQVIMALHKYREDQGLPP